MLQAGWSTQTLEPIEEIVGEEHKLEESLIAGEVVHGDFIQGIGCFELADDQFCLRPIIVEQPDMPGRGAQGGDEHLVRVALHLKEVQLGRRFGGDWATDDDESSFPLPALGFVTKL